MLNLPALNLNRSCRHRNMKRTILHILLMLLAATAVSSCSKGDFEVALDGAPSNDRSIVITGSATDSQSGEAIENISISFMAYPYDDESAGPLFSEEVYTNSEGIFTIHAQGSHQKLLCIIIAQDKEGIYESQTKQVIVTWEGTSFDRYNNIFVVNDCAFNLKKAK